jgi:acyl-coenzyme A thioesterase PaaI-like protein
MQDMIHNAIPLTLSAQLEVTEFERGYCKLTVPFDCNKELLTGNLHTAALYTLAEIPGGAVLMGAFNMQKYFPTLAS